MSNDRNGTDSDDQDERNPEPRTNQLMRRGFDDVSLATENAATQALIAKATADIQARWVMAMRRPRDMNDVRQSMIRECKRRGFARSAIYVLPRGDKEIKGLSIRFAEVAIRCMTNMSCEAQTIYDSDDERIVRVTATDFETNVTWPRDITIKKTVERKFLKKNQQAIRERINSYGDRVFVVDATDDDVATKEAALVSKAARTAILRLIPGNLQDECFDLCEGMIKDEISKDPDFEKNQVFDAFASLAIMPSQIAEWLGHAVEQVTPTEILELRKLYTGLREGDTNWALAMENVEQSREQIRKATKEAVASAKKGPPPAQAAAATPAKEQPKQEPAKQQDPALAKGTKPPAAEPAKATTTGKGTSALKEQLRDKPQETPAQPAPEQAKPVVAKTVDELPQEDSEERKCAACGVVIEVMKAEPAGAKCYSCRQI